MSRRWRVHHPGLSPIAGARIELGPEESHHVQRVLRLRPGDCVGVFDGRGHEWLARLVDSAAKRSVIELERMITDPVEAPLAVSLFQSACRPEKMEWVVQKACEIGVAQIHIVDAGDSRRVWGSPRRLQRLERIAVEACKQCERRIVPPLNLVPELPRAESGGGLSVLLAPGAQEPLAARMERSRPESVSIAVGPEGGFAAGDVERWLASGWIAAGLGPRILRTETAGLVAATIVLHRWGDVGRAPASNAG